MYATLLLLTLAVAGVCAVPLSLRHPRAAALAVIPVAVCPASLVLAGIPLTVPMMAIVLVGVLLSSRTERVSPAMLWLFAGLVVAIVASLVLHEPAAARTPTESRNSAIAVIMALSLVPMYAKAQPCAETVFRWLSVALAGSSAYLALNSTAVGGRLVAESTNSNAAGYLAASGVLCSMLAARHPEARARWLLLTLPCLYVLYAAQSRGAFTSLLAGLVAWALVALEGPRRVVAVLFGVVLFVALRGPLSAFAGDVLLAERSQQFVESGSRQELLYLAWRTFIDSPWGVGYAGFLDVSHTHFGFSLNTHNDWVRLFVEGGVLLGALALALVAGRLMARTDDPAALRAKVVLAAGCVAFLFSNTMADLRVSAPAFICAGLLWSRAQDRSERQDAGDRVVRRLVRTLGPGLGDRLALERQNAGSRRHIQPAGR